MLKKQPRKGESVRVKPEGTVKVCKYCSGIGYHHEWCTRPRDDKRPPKPTEPVPHEYCDGGSCWRLANRWEYAARYNDWIAVCDEHGDKIKASSTT